MKNLLIIFTIPILFLFNLSALFAQNHPRVLIDASDIPVINSKVQNQSNVYSYELYQKMRTYCLNFANYTTPFSDHQLNNRFVHVAFVAMLEENDTWKDNMINLALQFDQNFKTEYNDFYNMMGPIEDGFSATFYTIATALIFDFCYDRLSPSDKTTLINNIIYGLDFLRIQINNQGLFYKYNVGHGMMDAAYILGGLSIAGETSGYTWQDWKS